MSGTTVSLLTAPGSAAIAVIEVRGPQAYPLAKQLFTPTGKPLPEATEVGRFWFGTLGSDEVVLSVTDAEAIEVHCHGGPRVVRWVIEQFTANGVEERTLRPKAEGFELLQRAPTLRTASILLDQLNGAFTNEVRRILALLETDFPTAWEPLARLAQLGNTVGRHLVEPWKVVIAGPPNVGKSSLVNALAGYQRSVVSEVAGTTRDAVSTRIAIDGWPIELIDTAGVRCAEGLEAEGIERARRVLGEANLVVWVGDASVHEEILPDGETYAVVKLPRSTGWVTVRNKSDAWVGYDRIPWCLHVSATTGENIPNLIYFIIWRLIPVKPTPGDAIPFTPRLIELVNAASATHAEAARLLREALAASE